MIEATRTPACTFGMRFKFICECARMMSHARSMKRKRCLRRQLGMAGTLSMGTLERVTTARAPTAWIACAGKNVPCGNVPCGLCAPFGTWTVAPPDKLHVVLLAPHSRLTKASRDAGLVFLNTNLTRKGCTCDTAAAVRCPTWPLPAHLHPACAAARTYS